jgi:malonyl-CoA/methylmalonyl-CoA synthetase
MARTFQDLGVAKTDRVILCIQKSLTFVTAHLALQKIGAICVPLNPGFKKSEMDYLLHDADPKLILCEPDKAGLITEIDSGLTTLTVDTQRPYQNIDFFRSAPEEYARVDIEPDDPGLIIYTSGTTGKPKGAAYIFTGRSAGAHAGSIFTCRGYRGFEKKRGAIQLYGIYGGSFDVL